MARGVVTAGIVFLSATFALTGVAAQTPPALTILTIDDDAPGDPGPHDPGVSDPLEDGTAAHPFDTIQEALALGLDEIELMVRPGEYLEGTLTLPSNCRLTGAGPAMTRIQGVVQYYGLGGTVTRVFSLRSLTLDGSVGLGSADQATLQDVVLTGGDLEALGTHDLTIEAFSVVDGSIGFTHVERLAADGLEMHDGQLFIYSSIVPLHAELRHLDAAGSRMDVSSGPGGNIDLLVEDSAVGALRAGWDGTFVVTARRVRFTGEGISVDTSEREHELRVSDSIFEHGGVTAIGNPDSDGDDRLRISLERDTFRQGGVHLMRGVGTAYDPQVYADWRIDSSTFLGDGISADIQIRPNYTFHGSTALTVANNVFLGSPVGVDVTYEYTGPQNPPTSRKDPIGTTIVNNTFFSAQRGIRLTTNEHVFGQNPVSNVIMNNIVAGGARGIEILGLDDQMFTIAGNDVYGAAEGRYLGSIPDRTGLDGNISLDPRLQDPAAGDVTLRPGSPCIDTGIVSPDVPTIDHAGTTRPQDGDGDGTALPDIGAFEFVDADGDGHAVGSDCSDSAPGVYTHAPQICGDGLNNDCMQPGWPSLAGTNESDDDGDSWTECDADCDDGNPLVYPGAAEICDHRDNDCNGEVDEDASGIDSDGDGVANVCDNCVEAGNPDQGDMDGDSEGDVCDLDDDLVYLQLPEPTRVEYQLERGAPTFNLYRGRLDVLVGTGA